MINAFAEGAVTLPSVDWATIFSTMDFSVLTSGVVALIPVLLPVLLVVFGMKNGWRFAKKSLRSIGKF